MSFPYVQASGTPYEIGLAHGRGLRDQIINSIACYRAMFSDYSNLEWSRAKELSKRFVALIGEYDAAYLEEMRGVADGASLDFEDIAAVLRDHVEFPSSICRHDDPKVPAGLSMGTVFSLLAELGTGEIAICAGNPCESPYEAYRL